MSCYISLSISHSVQAPLVTVSETNDEPVAELVISSTTGNVTVSAPNVESVAELVVPSTTGNVTVSATNVEPVAELMVPSTTEIERMIVVTPTDHRLPAVTKDGSDVRNARAEVLKASWVHELWSTNSTSCKIILFTLPSRIKGLPLTTPTDLDLKKPVFASEVETDVTTTIGNGKVVSPVIEGVDQLVTLPQSITVVRNSGITADSLLRPTQSNARTESSSFSSEPSDDISAQSGDTPSTKYISVNSSNNISNESQAEFLQT
ncbi:hypothetical protein NE237_014911 [Protea cynaroides]|uniref:Uncharacterized protein n=1 Tax=Protea cynaroides TaxID=273540 RepID=A0A9Q0KD07_9MAGN|nr:hypothetical protein NE237_014911 [Protea cynaroides]